MNKCEKCNAPNKDNLLIMNDDKSAVMKVCGLCFGDTDEQLRLKAIHNAASSIMFIARLIVNAICVSTGIYKRLDYFGIEIREDYKHLRETVR